MNQVPSNFTPVLTKVIRVPMRHTFTVEQKMILLQYFDCGMIGQSMAYHDKIVQCAQESGLDFEVVKNWVGNQRRKRRMEEMQSVSPEQYVNPASPHGKYSRVMSEPFNSQRPRHVLCFPRSSGDPVNFQRKTVSTCIPGPVPNMREENQGTCQYSPQILPVIESVDQAVSNLQQQPATSRPPHTEEHIPTHAAISTIPNQVTMQRDSSRSAPSGNIRLSSNNSHHYRVQRTSMGPNSTLPSQTNSSHALSSRAGPETAHLSPMELPQTAGYHHHHRMGHHQASQSQGSPQMGDVSQDGQYYYTDTPSRRIVPHSQHVWGTDNHNGDAAMVTEEDDDEQRDVQIQKIMETIQVYIDQLSKLGCEAFLASLSKDNFATYLCGTQFGNDYFTKINKDCPLSEFVEKRLEGRTEISKSDEEVESKNEEGIRDVVEDHDDDKGEKLDVEVNGKDVCDVKQDVIKAGEEVFIVNKKHFIIGHGNLLPAPYEKITLKTTLDEDIDVDENGFIEDTFS